MTGSAGEEIEKESNRIIDYAFANLQEGVRIGLYRGNTDAQKHWEMILASEISKSIITQVEKARAEERERCAKIADGLGGKFIGEKIRSATN